MGKLFVPKLSYANVMSTLALFIAIGGTSYATITITGKNVKDSSLTGADIKNASLRSDDIRDHALLGKDFRTGQLPAGPHGPRGPKGDPASVDTSSVTTRGATQQGSAPYGLPELQELASVSVIVGPGSRPVFILADVEYFGETAPCQMYSVLEWDGQVQDQTLSSQHSPGATAGNTRGSMVATAMPLLAPGPHTIKVRGLASAGCAFTNLPGNLHALVLDG
jgi:hypothetical protein